MTERRLIVDALGQLIDSVARKHKGPSVATLKRPIDPDKGTQAMDIQPRSIPA